MDRNWTPSIVPNGHDQNVYLVINNYGKVGTAFAETDIGEADLETTLSDLMIGEYSDPVRAVAFNTAERWSEDASEDVAREILRRLDLAGHEMPSSIQAFVESHLGADRQLLKARVSRCPTPGQSTQPVASQGQLSRLH
jgi:hypothetical protein